MSDPTPAFRDDDPGPGSPSVAVAELVASMSRASVGITKMLKRLDPRFGLSEFVVLVELEGVESVTNAKLAKKIGVSAQRLNQVVSELVKSGLVEINADPTDSRRRFIQLTDAGANGVATLKSGIDEVVASKLSFEHAGLQALARRVARLARDFRDDERPGRPARAEA